MSWVTDLVFVTPDGDAAARFAAAVERYHGWRPVLAENNGPQGSGALVYHLGMNHVDLDMLDEMETAVWPPGTVLYYQHECAEQPAVRTWAPEGS